MAKESLRFTTRERNAVERRIFVVFVSFSKVVNGLAVRRPVDRADVHFTGYITARVALEIGNVELSIGGPIFIHIGHARDVEDIGYMVTAGRESRGYDLPERDDVFERQWSVLRLQGSGESDQIRNETHKGFGSHSNCPVT
ncbi:MAG: hypothetical protein ACJ0SL_00320 [Candidatus Rariloculaceae bacterium]